MTDILPDCVKMLYILTDLYKNNYLTREEYIGHARLKIAFLSERIEHIANIQDKRYVLEILRNCRDALVAVNERILYKNYQTPLPN